MSNIMFESQHYLNSTPSLIHDQVTVDPKSGSAKSGVNLVESSERFARFPPDHRVI